MSLVAHQERGFSMFHLFGVVSGTFQPLLACLALFHFLEAAASQNVLACKIAMNQLHVDFITKDCKRYYKVEQLKVGITNWNRYYKEG